MAIKIYQSQIRPTTEVKERTATSGMYVDQATATMIPRAMKGMLQAGEDFWIKYEKQKAENAVIEAAKEIDQDKITEHPASGAIITQKEGLATRVNKYKESTKPDDAMAAYKDDWEKTLNTTLANLKGPFAKKMFKNYMNKRFISESGTIRDHTFVNFRNESKALKIKELDGISYRVANAQVGSKEHKMALADKAAFFTNQSNYELFGDQFKQLEFDTLNNIDVLTITKHLSQDPIKTLINFNNGVYKNLNAETKVKLQSKIVLAAQQKMAKNIDEDTIRATYGLEAEFDAQSYLKAFEGYETYDAIKLAVDMNNYVRNAIQQVHTSKSEDLSTVQLYPLTGSGAEIAAKHKANQVIQSAISDRITSINNGDAAGYVAKIDMEVDGLVQKINTEDDFDKRKTLIEEKNLLLDKKYEELNVASDKRFYMSQAEAQSVVKQITDPGKTWQEKKGILLSLSETYGKDKMQGILQHLSMEKLPTHYLVAMSTNSANLNEDILAAHSTKDLEKVVKSELPSGTTLNDVRKKISKKIDKWEQVIENQLPGSFDVVEYKKAVEDTLYRAALIRIDRGDGVNDAANSVSKEFLSDYHIDPGKTYFIPVDVNGKRVNVGVVQTKAEAIELAVQDGDYLDRFMEKDYTHYADDRDLELLSKKDINIKMKSTIKRNTVWLLNNKSTGLVLYFKTNDGPIPIANSKGQKIEFYFTDQVGQDKNIFSTEYIEPGTGLPLTVIEPYDVFGGEQELYRQAMVP
mgnify:FL=1